MSMKFLLSAVLCVVVDAVDLAPKLCAAANGLARTGLHALALLGRGYCAAVYVPHSPVDLPPTPHPPPPRVEVGVVAQVILRSLLDR